MADPGSIFHAYAALLALRKKVKSLVYGEFTPLAEPGQLIAYRRGAWNGFPAVHIVLNWSPDPQPWPDTLAAPKETPLFGNYPNLSCDTLRPWEALIFQCD
ncbi:MAG: hypothetical protein H7067_00785 [Burkholderiales bacterium]|nr:hypothetical protein [Opitutaceae bacterium]